LLCAVCQRNQHKLLINSDLQRYFWRSKVDLQTYKSEMLAYNVTLQTYIETMRAYQFRMQTHQSDLHIHNGRLQRYNNRMQAWNRTLSVCRSESARYREALRVCILTQHTQVPALDSARATSHVQQTPAPHFNFPLHPPVFITIRSSSGRLGIKHPAMP
jgi:hypothetical protein